MSVYLYKRIHILHCMSVRVFTHTHVGFPLEPEKMTYSTCPDLEFWPLFITAIALSVYGITEYAIAHFIINI